MRKYKKKPKELHKPKGYRPNKGTKAWRQPSDAEPKTINNIKDFVNTVNVNDLNINWGKGKRGPDASNILSLLAVWIYGYMKGIPYGRKLEKELKRNKDLQYLSCGKIFSFSVLNKFRRALGSSLNKLLLKLSEWNGEPQNGLYLDGTMIQGASSKYEFRNVKDLEKNKNRHIEKALEGNARSEKRVSLYEKAIEYCKIHSEINCINLFEYDMRAIRHGTMVCKGYNALIMCDYRRRPYYGMVTIGIRESPHLLSFIESAKKYVDFTNKFLVADRDFYTFEAIAYLYNQSILPVIHPRKDSTEIVRQKKNKYSKDNYKFDEIKNLFTCPSGKQLEYKSTRKSKKVNKYVKKMNHHIYRSNYKDCKDCKLKINCLSNKKSKVKELCISVDDTIIQKHKEWMSSYLANELLKMRYIASEGINSTIKDKKRFRVDNFILKGIDNVQIELVLTMVAVSVEMGKYSHFFYFFK